MNLSTIKAGNVTQVSKRANSILPIQWIISTGANQDEVFQKSMPIQKDSLWKQGCLSTPPQGFIISCFWLMISIWWGREQMRWLANYRGFTISRFLLPPTVPPPVNQLWMIARHKSWIEMSDRKIFKGWLARRESVIGSSVGQWAHLPITTPERMVRWSDIPFYSKINCIVCLIVSFVCLLHELNPNFSLISKLNIQVEASKTKPQN